MIKSETALLERVLEHDQIIKKAEDLEQKLFFKKDLLEQLKLEVEELRLENDDLLSVKEISKQQERTIREKGLEIARLKQVVAEREDFEDSLQLKILELQERDSQWMKEIVELRAKVIHLEHVNQINIQNNRLIFNAQRIEFSRLNLGRPYQTKYTTDCCR